MADTNLYIWLKLKDEVSKPMRGVQGQLRNFAQKFKQHWVAISASVVAGVIAVKKAFDGLQLATKIAQQEDAFKNLAKSFNVSSKRIIEDLTKASAGTLTTMELMEKASKAMVLGLNPEKFGQLMRIARAAARAMGESVEFMFDSIVLGIGRQSRMILDNLGIIVKAEEAYKKYAEKLGKTVEQLTEAEKRTAFFNAALKAGEDIIRRVNMQSRSNAENLQIISASLREARNEILKFITQSTDLTEVADKFRNIAKAIKEVRVGLMIGQMKDLQAEIRNLIAPSNPLLKLRNAFNNMIGSRNLVLLKKFSRELADIAINLKKQKIFFEEKSVLTLLTRKDLERYKKAIAEIEKANAGMGKILKNQFKEAGKGIHEEKKKITENVKKEWKFMKELSIRTAQEMENAFSDFFFKVFTGQLRNLKDVLTDFSKTIVQAFSQILAHALIIKMLKGTALGGWLGFQMGTPYVPKTGMYMLHKGEAVVPAHKINEAEGSSNINYYIYAIDAASFAQLLYRNKAFVHRIIEEGIKTNSPLRGAIKQYG